MEPLYREGERVVTYNWASVQTRDVIVFKIKDRFYIKRINRISGSKIIVSGDRKIFSSKLPPIDFSEVIGRVIFKY